MSSKDRQALIVGTSLIGIIMNLLFAGIKIVIGLTASSLSIISEGLNNATDSANSFLTIIGAKLSAKHPDKEHPFGYGRVEYLTNLMIAILILYTGISLLKESIDGIVHPSSLDVSVLMIIIILISAIAKFIFGIYTIRMGKKAESAALETVGTESKNDSLFSFLTIAVSLIYLTFHISLDAYAGVIFSAVILKTGYDILKDTVNELLGRPGKEELAKKLYKEIRHTKGIVHAADLMLHNYGPDAYSGSVNIEIDHKETIGEVYTYIHELQLRIMYEYNVTLVFGIYAIDNDHEQIREVRKQINAFIQSREHVKSYHALYLDSNNRMYCDLVVDYELMDWDALEEDFKAYFKGLHPEREIMLTIETEYV